MECRLCVGRAAVHRVLAPLALVLTYDTAADYTTLPEAPCEELPDTPRILGQMRPNMTRCALSCLLFLPLTSGTLPVRAAEPDTRRQ